MNKLKSKAINKPNVERFFETLAKILSEKYGAEISMLTDTTNEPQERKNRDVDLGT